MAPAVAGRIQTVVALILVVPFAILGLDPVLALFSWFSGLAVVALLVLYVLTSLAVVAFFRRHREGSRQWQTRVAPLLALVLLAWVLYLVVNNFTALIGGSMTTAISLLVVVPLAFLVGLLTESAVSARRGKNRRKTDQEPIGQ